MILQAAVEKLRMKVVMHMNGIHGRHVRQLDPGGVD